HLILTTQSVRFFESKDCRADIGEEILPSEMGAYYSMEDNNSYDAGSGPSTPVVDPYNNSQHPSRLADARDNKVVNKSTPSYEAKKVKPTDNRPLVRARPISKEPLAQQTDEHELEAFRTSWHNENVLISKFVRLERLKGRPIDLFDLYMSCKFTNE